MASQLGRSRVGRSKSSARPDRHGESMREHLDDHARRLVWAIAAVSARLEDLRHVWAEALGVSAPQWMILMAVNDCNLATGTPVREVAAKLEVDPSFVASQSKLLEKLGFLARSTSKEDSRVMLLSLTALAQKEISKLDFRQSALNRFVYEYLSPRELDEIITKLTVLSERLEKASLRLELEA
jgi:DNA-binding MarR family transcriptional regulator